MSRTQDLVLARLRLVAGRWQGDPATLGADTSAHDWAGADSPDPLPHDHPPHRQLEEEPCEDADPPHGGWPAPRLWLRLIGTLVVVVLAGASALLATSWPRERPADPMAEQEIGEPGATFADPFPSASPAPSVLVHVVGDVRRPGVVRLPAGARVADAVEHAGGLRRNGRIGATNLARQVADGERIEVGAPHSAPGVDGPAGVPDPPQVDLNTATADQLDALPGVGPVTAAKILAWRAEHGRFSVVDELAEVAGIGPKTLAEVRSLVRV